MVMKKHLKMTVLAVCLVLSLVIMSGCSLFGPSSAKDVIAKCQSNVDKIENCHLDGELTMNLTMTIDDKDVAAALGMNKIDMPVDMEFKADAGKESAHGTADVDMSMMGEKVSESVETYYDMKDGYIYTKSSDSDTWTKSSSDQSITDLTDMADMDFEKADWDKFSFEKTDKGYKVSVAIKDMGDAFGTDFMTAYLEDADFDDFELGDEGTVTYEFDKECRLISTKIEDLTMTATSSLGEGLGNMVCDVVVDGTVDVSKFNELDEDDYTVPKKVIKSAESGSTGSGILDPGFGTDDPDPVDPTTGNDDPTPAPIVGNGVLLNGADAQGKNNKWCFTVGEDIKAGTYKVYRASSESGIMSVTDAVTFDQNYDFSMGFGNDDDTPDGTTVVLDNGDQIYITEDLIVEFR